MTSHICSKFLEMPLMAPALQAAQTAGQPAAQVKSDPGSWGDISRRLLHPVLYPALQGAWLATRLLMQMTASKSTHAHINTSTLHGLLGCCPVQAGWAASPGACKQYASSAMNVSCCSCRCKPSATQMQRTSLDEPLDNAVDVGDVHNGQIHLPVAALGPVSCHPATQTQGGS